MIFTVFIKTFENFQLHKTQNNQVKRLTNMTLLGADLKFIDLRAISSKHYLKILKTELGHSLVPDLASTNIFCPGE